MPDGDFKLVYYEFSALTAELQAGLEDLQRKVFRRARRTFSSEDFVINASSFG
jgi:hypothetical protein